MFDSHTHSHLRGPEDLESMAAAGIDNVTVCAFLPSQPLHAETLCDLFQWLLNEESTRLKHYGIHPWIALGIHPRCIPRNNIPLALSNLEHLFDSHPNLSLGEVGLETSSNLEQDILVQQLRMAQKRSLPVILHTPRKGKADAVKHLLHILSTEKISPSHLIVDHLTPDLVEPVLSFGAIAGLTVQKGKLSPSDVTKLIQEWGADRFVVNSDLSHAPSGPTTVAWVANHLRSEGIDEQAVQKVTSDNALRILASPR